MTGRPPAGYAWALRGHPSSPWHLARDVPFNNRALCGTDIGERFQLRPLGETRRECAKCLTRAAQLAREPKTASDVYRRGA